MKLLIAGATGLVGNTLLKIIDELNFAYSTLLLAASDKSIGKPILFNETLQTLISMQEALDEKPDIAIFSAGSEMSKLWTFFFAERGSWVIDNSSAWRMDENVPLVVPEVNATSIKPESRIIANPNCSTIQMVIALAPIHKRYGIKRVVVSTYQSVSGSGYKGVNQLEDEQKGKDGQKFYPHQIFNNCFPHGGDFLENAYTTEEMKLVHETRRILNEPKLPITATVVRIPVNSAHSESVNIELEKTATPNDIRKLLLLSESICVVDNPSNNEYPTPIMAKGKNEVFVGRIRKDESIPNGINLWIVADNLRKGAATNAIQIATYIRNSFCAQNN